MRVSVIGFILKWFISSYSLLLFFGGLFNCVLKPLTRYLVD